ncbi:hypothetical protein EJB05_24626, partial [Eragrostis curvula]
MATPVMSLSTAAPAENVAATSSVTDATDVDVAATAAPSATDSQGTDWTHAREIKRRKLKSVRVLVNGKWKAECMWCKSLLGGETRNGTTHLHDHLNCYDARSCRKGKELALMICLLEYPLSVVDHVGFRNFFAAMQPMFKVPTKNTIWKDIFDMHVVQRGAMIKFVYVPAPHNVLHEVLVDCHLERKVSTITLDNYSTNDNMKNH